jgi:hypothetical protein
MYNCDSFGNMVSLGKRMLEHLRQRSLRSFVTALHLAVDASYNILCGFSRALRY